MDKMREAFLALPDTVIITDKYLNVLDFNHSTPFETLKKGAKLTDYFSDFCGACEDTVLIGKRTYQRKISAVQEGGVQVGFTVYLADTTEKMQLLTQNREKSMELQQLVEKQRQANAELSEYVRQAERIADYSEQLRIAHNIHDDAGHAITAIHTIAQMCLNLRDTDQNQYDELLSEGISICEQALKVRENRKCASLSELLEAFRAQSPFPIEVLVSGEEPEFVSELYDTVYALCKEAHHNTLSHSMADKQMITAAFTKDSFTLSVFDNGSFHGVFELGFGLTAMCERVRKSGGAIRFHTVEGEGFGIAVEWREKR